MGDVNITYETLFELLRREKTKNELQKLDDTFFIDVANYLKGKEESLEQQKHKQDLFASEEKAKAEKQLENIRKILKELYERREKKIIDMALNVSRAPSIVIDTSIMLVEERNMYDNIRNLLDSFRVGVLANLQQAKVPDVKLNGLGKKIDEKQSEEHQSTNLQSDSSSQLSPISNEINTKPVETSNELPNEDLNLKSENKPENLMKNVKFTHEVPKFLGIDLKEYGPFEAGDNAELPPEVADVLINKGRAE